MTSWGVSKFQKYDKLSARWRVAQSLSRAQPKEPALSAAEGPVAQGMP